VSVLAHSADRYWHPDVESRFPTYNGSTINIHDGGNSRSIRFPIHVGMCEPKN
jgi:hypothetical protein